MEFVWGIGELLVKNVLTFANEVVYNKKDVHFTPNIIRAFIFAKYKFMKEVNMIESKGWNWKIVKNEKEQIW